LNAATPSAVSLTHQIQTNATLLSHEWCDLLKEYKVEVGVSLDGPEQLHNLHRQTRGGIGTFSKAFAGISLLRQHRIPFHIIAVLTRASLQHAAELFELFESLGPTRTAFNSEEIEGINRHSSLQFSGVEVAYRQFFERYLDLVQSRNSTQRVREIHDRFAW